MWAVVGFGYWAITDRTTGEFLGEGGFADFRRGITELVDVPEAGWAIAPRAWGSGIATEAVTAMLAWADNQLAISEVKCIIDDSNAASLRVAEKCGFEIVGRVSVVGGASNRWLLSRQRRQVAAVC